MAGGEVSEEKLRSVLMQAMLAAKNIRPQRDRLVHLRRELKHLSPGSGVVDDTDTIRKLARDLFDVYFIGIEAGARMLACCLELAAKYGGRLDFSNFALVVIRDEQLYDVLLARRFPPNPRPTTQTDAFSLVELTLHAVKLLQELHVPLCIELLIGERPPNVTGEPPQVSGMRGYSDDPFAAALEHLAKNGLPDPAVTRKAKGKAQQAAPGRIDVDHALTYLYRACSLASFAVSHIDLAVVVLSSFLEPKDAASLSEFTDQHKYISEKGPYPSEYHSESD